MRNQRGFTLIEILVVVSILSILMGLVVSLVSTSERKGSEITCINNVRDLAGLLEQASPGRYPEHGGPGQLLYLVATGSLKGRDLLGNLFCPGDLHESLEQCGGEAAFASLDLDAPGNGRLTSYAARARDLPARKGAIPPVVLLADDSA